jgi:hypothetical protein
LEHHVLAIGDMLVHRHARNPELASDVCKQCGDDTAPVYLPRSHLEHLIAISFSRRAAPTERNVRVSGVFS